MMLTLLIYCYAIGIFPSRRIERATWRDLGVRFVAASRQRGRVRVDVLYDPEREGG